MRATASTRSGLDRVGPEAALGAGGRRYLGRPGGEEEDSGLERDAVGLRDIRHGCPVMPQTGVDYGPHLVTSRLRDVGGVYPGEAGQPVELTILIVEVVLVEDQQPPSLMRVLERTGEMSKPQLNRGIPGQLAGLSAQQGACRFDRTPHADHPARMGNKVAPEREGEAGARVSPRPPRRVSELTLDRLESILPERLDLATSLPVRGHIRRTPPSASQGVEDGVVDLAER